MGAGACVDRRTFLKGAALAGAGAAAGSLGLAGCTGAARGGSDERDAPSGQADPVGLAAEASSALPAASPDPESDFGVDSAINMKTIDGWLDRDDVAYRDVRLFFDPADFASMGGDPDLSATIEGFKVAPFPYVATLRPLPIDGAYTGRAAWNVVWGDDGSIVSAEPNYRESRYLLEDLFPQDKAVFLMCGAGGYAGMARDLLVHLGWDAAKVYNVGGFWSYGGDRGVRLIERSPETGEAELCCPWRVDYAAVDFDRMHPLSAGEEAEG